MSSWRGSAVLVLIGILVGGLPFGTLWLSARSDARTAEAARKICQDVIDKAKARVSESSKGSAELARRPLAEIAKRAEATRTSISFDGPEEMAVVALERGEPAPFSGGLFGRVKFADAVKALEDRDAWAVQLEEGNQKLWESEAREKSAVASARRMRRKLLPLTVGTGIAVYGLAKKKPWISATGLGLGIGGAILF
jgi:hypothetical protein